MIKRAGVVRCPFGSRVRASFGMKSLKLLFLCEKCEIGASHFRFGKNDACTVLQLFGKKNFCLEQALFTPLGDSCESRLTCS